MIDVCQALSDNASYCLQVVGIISASVKGKQLRVTVGLARAMNLGLGDDNLLLCREPLQRCI